MTDPDKRALLEHRWDLAPSAVVERLGDAVVAVQLRSDRVLELNETAGRLLDLLAEGLTAAEATRRMATEYEVADAALRNDVYLTLKRLEDEGILARRDP